MQFSALETECHWCHQEPSLTETFDECCALCSQAGTWLETSLKETLGFQVHMACRWLQARRGCRDGAWERQSFCAGRVQGDVTRWVGVVGLPEEDWAPQGWWTAGPWGGGLHCVEVLGWE